jgi:hypothetical protein
MPYFELTLFFHVLLFAYWLGGDLGVYLKSKYVVDPSLSRESRLLAMKIMASCDLGPKICMSLMLTVGGVLSELHGITHPWWQMVGIVLLGPAWLAMVLILHYRHGASYIPVLTRIDFLFRIVLILGLVVSTSYSWFTGRLVEDPWMAVKLLVFAALVFFGLMIRINLKGFNETLDKLVADDYSEQDNLAMIDSRRKVVPWVMAIWAGLAIEAGLGIVQPGSPEKVDVPMVIDQQGIDKLIS